MGLGDVVLNHRPTLAPSEEKAAKNKQAEIVKELVPDNNAAAVEKRGPGRPRKNSGDTPQPKPRANSKSPSRKAGEPELPHVAPKTGTSSNVTAEEAAAAIGNQSVVRQLRVYCKRFPQFAPPAGYNPWLYSPEQNRRVIDEIKQAVKAEVEFLTAPCMIRDSIGEAERIATLWAVTHPDSPASSTILQFRNASSAVLSDPAVDLDLALLECEISGFLPDSPIVRLLINTGRVLLKVFNNNAAQPQQAQTDEKKFSEF